MADDYHHLENLIEVGAAEPLAIPRAQALRDAVRRQRDYSLIQVVRRSVDGVPALECLVVEVACDGVPSRNAAGIRYRERLALSVPADPKKLVEVLALRKDFPTLIHQNQTIPGGPASLCLYFEPPATVLRTWTPAAFLRRIQWWLERSATGELHPADQPVDHLFFASKYELILPWNLRELQQDPAIRFVLVQVDRSPDEGCTFLFSPISKNASQETKTAYVELTVPPIVHGQVERDPRTLGQLAEVLSQRGVDLMTSMRTALQAAVDEGGSPESEDSTGTVILLHVPIRRDQDAQPEGTTHRAFLVPTGRLELGAATGALLSHNGRYYQDLLGAQIATAWRDQPVWPMDVLRANDAAAARRQSGITEEGPRGVVIGAGSLGSALLNLWGRSGWGQWTAVDKDHVKPHNLSRYVAYARHLGKPKATVVAELHRAATRGATEVVPIVADAIDFAQEPINSALNAAKFVVDASTTLEYPRAASAVDTLPRHCSVFVTPDGNGAVLLAEDRNRSHRLRTLEAQYYRALTLKDWGATHLTGHPSTFWSGGSCRDISAVLPYSRILGHASTLAEQIQAASVCETALIRVWHRNPLSGAVEVYGVPVLPERRIVLADFDLFIDHGAEQYMREIRSQGFPNETGGVLLGYYDFNIKAVIVVAGLPAPPDSKASPDSFERGVVGLADAVKAANSRTAGMVGYIGEWHSHPPAHSASPSRLDLVQLAHLARGMADDGLPAIQLIIGEDDLQVLKAEVR